MNTISPPLPCGRISLILFFLFLLFCVPNISVAQNAGVYPNFWKTTTVDNHAEIVRTSPLPAHFHAYNLNVAELLNTVADAPERFSNSTSEVIISLPSANGISSNFSVQKSSVFAESLSKKYLNFSSFHLQSIDNQNITARLNVTPNGIYALIYHPENGLTYLEPYSQNQENSYIAYQAKNLGTTEQHAEFSCNVTTGIEENEIQESLQNDNSDCFLRRYRLCVSATGEYTQWHGGTVADAMAKIMILTANTNLVFERETGITFELIDNNDQMVFTNPLTDPFTNDNKFLLLSENQAATDNVIGSLNYDLGVVVGIFGGGVAQLKSVCTSNRAQSSAGSTWSPEGYPLESTFIHEIAHKYGATHSFNNSCNNNRVNISAFETGSGSTLMSYAGACSPSVTYPRDYYFHAGNLEQMRNFLQFDLINSCGEILPLGNPTTTADAGLDKILPVGIPFELTGNTSNPSNVIQNFSWEQMDAQPAAAPPTGTDVSGPAFRSHPATENNTRSFPSLNCLLDSANSDCEWEVLTEVPRTMNFRFTAYNAYEGAGCWANDDLLLSFVEPEEKFQINYPNGGENFTTNQQIEVLWNTGETEISPINSPAVDVLLSTDGGRTFPTILATNIPNTGATSISLTDDISEQCRIKIKGFGHYFFDLSDADFSIAAPGNFALHPIEPIQSFCGISDEIVTFEIEVTADENFTSPVTFPTSDNTGEISISYSQNQVTPPAVITVNITGSHTQPDFVFNVSATSAGITQSTQLNIQHFDNQPIEPQIISPAANETQTEFDLNLVWANENTAAAYAVEISHSPDFTNLFYSETTTENNLEIKNLSSNAVYYWRVRSVNTCGQSAWSEVSAFKTKNRVCSLFSAVNTPRPIEENEYSDAFARITIEEDFLISKMRIIDLSVEHTHIGDLTGNLIAPDGSNRQLFYRPGLESDTPYGCVHDDLLVSFDDNATANAEAMRAICNPVPAIGISGNFQPKEDFSPYVGTSSFGHWLVNINDLSPQDGGTLQDVSLELCRDDLPLIDNLNISSNALEVEQFNSVAFSQSQLNLSDNTGIFQLLSLPQNGNLELNGTPLFIGDNFSIADITSGSLVYLQNGMPALSDAFLIDATNSENEWSGIHEVTINITLSAPFPTAAIQQNISCNGENDGTIQVQGAFGTPPYQFSLDGENFQSEGIFTNLNADNYSVFIKDSAGNIAEGQSISLANPQVVSAFANVENRDIIVQANGGTGNFSYSLDNESFQNENVFSTIQDGYYTVYVQDENGCSTQTATVLVNNLSVEINTTQDLICHNDTDGSIEISTADGISPFQYRLNGAGEYQSENVFTNLPAGEYFAEVSDASGLIISSQMLSISNPQALTATANVTDYTIEINAENDQMPLTYSVDGADFTTENTFNGAPQSSYVIVVKNAVGCTTEISAEITTLPPVISTLETNDVLCYDGTNGEVIINGANGVAPYEYQLQSLDFQEDNFFPNLTAGEYIVQVRDAGGFLSPSQTIEIFEPNEIQVSATSLDSDLLVNATGGTGSFQYQLDGGEWQMEATFVNIPNGIYDILVEDENGCQRTINYIHNTNSLSVSTQTEIVNPCDLETPIFIEVCATGGIEPYEISTFPEATNITETETEDCASFYILEYPAGSSGEVEVMTSDVLGTQFTNLVNLQVADTLAITFSLNDDDLSITSISGTPPFMYSLDGENYQASGFFPDLENGTYPIYAIDARGCMTEASIFVDIVSSLHTSVTTSFSLYPNPASDVVYLDFGEIQNEAFQVTIFDAAGRLVFDNSFSGTRIFEVDLSDFSVGFYEVRVLTKEGFGYAKLVIF